MCDRTVGWQTRSGTFGSFNAPLLPRNAHVVYPLKVIIVQHFRMLIKAVKEKETTQEIVLTGFVIAVL